MSERGRVAVVLIAGFVVQVIAISCGFGFHPQPYGPDENMPIMTPGGTDE